MEQAIALMSLLISTVIAYEPLSSHSSLIETFAGAVVRIFPIKRPIAKVNKR